MRFQSTPAMARETIRARTGRSCSRAKLSLVTISAAAPIETAREYPYTGLLPFPKFGMGINEGRLPDGDVVDLKNRLPGHPISWRSCELKPRPPKPQQQECQMLWDPYRQCSWPPEYVAIEQFRTLLFSFQEKQPCKRNAHNQKTRKPLS